MDVVTSAFMEDFQAYSLNDQLAFVAGFSPSEVTGQFQLRGFSAPTVMVDGFRRFGLVDTSDVDRIEVIKGSAASIYGAIQPGGAVNILTRQPTTTPTENLQLGGGSDDFYRAALFSSGPLGNSGKLFYRLDVANQFNKYSDEFVSKHTDFISGKVLYKPDDQSSLTIDFQHSEIYEHPFAQVLTVTEKQTMPWAGNSVTESQYYGMATNGLLNYNYQGPESYIHQRVSSATLTYQHSFGDFWSLKFGANAFVNPYNDQLVGSGAYYPYGTGNVTVVNGVVQQAFAPEVKDQPSVDWKPQRGGGMQLDNLFSFNTGPIGNKLLFTADYYELSQRILTLIPEVAGAQATDYYALYSPYNPSGAPYYTPGTAWSPAMGYGWNTTLYGANPSLYSGVSTDQWIADGDYGLFGSERASMFANRLILMAGGRWDYVRNQVKNYNMPANGTNGSALAEPAAYQAFDYNTSAWTYELGASFKLTDTVNLYANKSTAFNPQPQIDTTTGLPLPNNKSDGYEFGVKAGFLGNRLNVSLDRFVINEHNLVQSETDPVTGLKDSILSGLQRAEGYELTLNYQVSNGFYVQGDWGYTQSVVLQSDTLTFLNDLPARRVPRNNVGGAMRYEISGGPLKGLFFLLDGKYYSKSLVNLGSGKSLIAGPASTTVGSTTSMYYDPAANLTYTSGTDPKIANEVKISSTPVINLPFPGNGLLPYPGLAAGQVINFPVGQNGKPLVLANPAVANVYTGVPTGVFVDDGREFNYNAPYALIDIGTGYSWKSMWATRSTVRVSAKNALNRKYTFGSGAPGAPFQIVTTYNLKF